VTTRNAYLVGSGQTAFGRIPEASAVDLMARAAQQALDDAGMERGVIDGVITGYATTQPHLMLASLFCERISVHPVYAHSVQLGGATGAAIVMLAGHLVRLGVCNNIMVVSGENRLSGQSRDLSIQTLAQVGDADYEVPNGASVPAYYALMASRYLHDTGASEADLAEFAVLMRKHASGHADAHLRDPLSIADVLASKTIASPLKLADCCPISDGAVAIIVSSKAPSGARVVLSGSGQAHRHQHLSAWTDLFRSGASDAVGRALNQAGCRLDDINLLGIYDSFTITLAMLLEEIGFAHRGQASHRLRAGDFDLSGSLPLNPHGGLLSFGHCGVAGGMAHIVETIRQLSGQAGSRQIKHASRAYIHADGGVMSSHVGLVIHREA
jgi:acetyl-CoA acetyltransferase